MTDLLDGMPVTYGDWQTGHGRAMSLYTVEEARGRHEVGEPYSVWFGDPESPSVVVAHDGDDNDQSGTLEVKVVYLGEGNRPSGGFFFAAPLSDPAQPLRLYLATAEFFRPSYAPMTGIPICTGLEDSLCYVDSEFGPDGSCHTRVNMPKFTSFEIYTPPMAEDDIARALREPRPEFGDYSSIIRLDRGFPTPALPAAPRQPSKARPAIQFGNPAGGATITFRRDPAESTARPAVLFAQHLGPMAPWLRDMLAGLPVWSEVPLSPGKGRDYPVGRYWTADHDYYDVLADRICVPFNHQIADLGYLQTMRLVHELFYDYLHPFIFGPGRDEHPDATTIQGDTQAVCMELHSHVVVILPPQHRPPPSGLISDIQGNYRISVVEASEPFKECQP